MDSFSIDFNTYLDPFTSTNIKTSPYSVPLWSYAHLVFLCPYSFAFSRRLYKWILTVYNLLRLASLTQCL